MYMALNNNQTKKSLNSRMFKTISLYTVEVVKFIVSFTTLSWSLIANALNPQKSSTVKRCVLK